MRRMIINEKFNGDSPFSAFITNLGKYNAGELVGEWVSFPTTYEEIQQAFKRIDIDGVRYEEFFITDYDDNAGNLCSSFGEYESLDELNYLAGKIAELNEWDLETFLAALELGEYSGTVKNLINLTDNLDNYEVYADIENYYDLGYYYINESGIYDVDSMGTLGNYIDYEAFGRDIAMDESGDFTSHGYVVGGKDTFREYYNGDHDIPEEYLVTAKPKDVELDAARVNTERRLPERNKLEQGYTEFER